MLQECLFIFPGIYYSDQATEIICILYKQVLFPGLFQDFFIKKKVMQRLVVRQHEKITESCHKKFLLLSFQLANLIWEIKVLIL